MELIIIPMLTTIALIAMQALDFIGTRGSREWATQLQAGDELTDTAVLQILESAPAVAPQPHTVHGESSPRKQHAA